MSLFFERLQALAQTQGDRPAICDDRRCITYGQLHDVVHEKAGLLAGQGVGPGRRIGISIADEYEHLVASVALLRVGAWQLTLATHDTDTVRTELADRIGVTHVVGNDAQAPADLTVVDWPLSSGPTAAFADNGGVFFRTSGTTGASNLVQFSDNDIALQAQRNPEYASGRHLRLASVEHNNSKRHRLYCLFMGATNVLKPADPYDLEKYAVEQGVTCIDMSIMHAVSLADAAVPPKLPGIDIRVGGSATPGAVRKRLQLCVSEQLYVRYGSTETGTIAICSPGAHDPDDPVGRPVGGLTVEIVNGEGRQLPSGVAGHIRMKGAGIASGYVDSPEQTAKRFRDGWFWPGDIGLLRADGVLVVKGRADEMIILNGINIFPAEIERILEAHPAVAVAAAAGLKSAAHGDIPVAAVELRADAEVDERTLLRFAREQLALRAPRRIRIVAALPRNPQGKLLRREVPQLFAAPARNDGDRM